MPCWRHCDPQAAPHLRSALAHDLDILGHPEGDDKEFQDYAKYALSRKMTGNGNT
jgi:hypothetical protein